MLYNIEEIKIDRSDSPDEMTQNRIKSQRAKFELIMNEQESDIEYLSPSQLETAVSSCYQDTAIEELLDVEKVGQNSPGTKSSKGNYGWRYG